MIINRFNFAPLYNYRFKYVGIFISVVALLLFVLYFSNLMDFPITKDIAYWSLCVGLFCVICSKEKNETAKIIEIRNQVSRLTLIILIASLLAYKFASIIIQYDMQIKMLNNVNLLFIVLVFELFYLFAFYTLLILNIKLSDNAEVLENFQNNNRLYICFIIIILLTFLLLII